MSDRKQALTSFLYRGFQSGLGLLTSVASARYLGPTLRGDFNTAGVNMNVGMTFVGGYTNYYAFAIAKRPEDIVETVQMGNLLVFLASLIVWLATFLLIFIPNPWFHLGTIMTWTLLCMPTTFIFGYGSRILNSIHQITWLNRVNMAQPLLFLIIYIPLTLFTNMPASSRLLWTFVIWLASYVGQMTLTLVVTYYLLHRKGVMKWRFSKLDWRGTVDYGSWSSLAQVASYVNYRMDYWIVAVYLSRFQLGIYSTAVAAAEVLNTLAQSISTLVFARMTGGQREDAIQVTETASRQTIISSSIAAIGLYIIGPLFVLLYGHKYRELIEPFYILLPGLVFKGASNVVIQYATNSIGRPKTSIWMNAVVFIVNALCCVIFIPKLGMSGGALASTISYIVGFVVYIIWFGRITGRNPKGLWRISRGDFVPYFDMLESLVRKLSR